MSTATTIEPRETPAHQEPVVRTQRFNMNESVLLTLNDRGREAFEKHYRLVGVEPPPLVVDDQGRSRFQLHVAFQMFGDDMMQSHFGGCPFETEIELILGE